ncbi:aromatic ring-hydroxylating dioxygenase subunit alpha [Novosphingobium beihaiensis]|uniref:Aromatic ring-hydroxylating dioxygenase subunit alpha n=1 Tax=Novosphingobium beihaiensis TaxID=2930389 RepID=A0ABT0BLA7_9SPHN|nr:aromatic ring-hydroxylating dioxygenase subunit alpha [Novosphingobium beihaiensis]MCJ2185846.1 aromatic ring-hydroxylating dioxygenase subunit alpha [Novosphingobium beihaiensis]
MADRNTPFVFDCWYAAGFSHEFGRDLFARTILGKPLVFYRTQDGAPVALSDRCVHRSFPLSHSTLDGDTIVCGYHGLRFDPEGACIEVPAQQGPCPAGIGVRSYALREQGPLVWIWMGDGEPDADLPAGEWIGDPQWPASQQYYHLPASYVALHENLLDLTHLSFLHAGTFGTPDFACAPYDLELDEERGNFKLIRTVKPTRLPPVWAEPLKLTGVDAVRQTTSEFAAPSAHLVHGHFYALSDEAFPPDTRIITAHLPTPETATTTHYFIHHGRNFAVEDDTVTDFMQQQLAAAFVEDIEGLTALEKLASAIPQDDQFEISLASDRAGVAMRRWLLKAATA